MTLSMSIALLTYLLIVTFAYMVSIFSGKTSRLGYLVINKSYTNAFMVLFINIAIIVLMIVLPFIPVDSSSAGKLILGGKFLSILTLCISLFVLSKKYAKHQPPASKS